MERARPQEKGKAMKVLGWNLRRLKEGDRRYYNCVSYNILKPRIDCWQCSIPTHRGTKRGKGRIYLCASCIEKAKKQEQRLAKKDAKP
jgi:hypothetical protein